MGSIRRLLRTCNPPLPVLETAYLSGAVAGILAGAIVDIYWMLNLASTGVYELFPGFVAGIIFAVVASVISKEPEKEVLDLFDRALNSKK